MNLNLFRDETPSQGAQAGRSGHSLELIVEALFKARGVRAVNDNPEFHHEKQLWQRNEKFLIRQVRLHGRIVDFLYKDFGRGVKLPIECKQQLGTGTTEEKLAYTVNKLIKITKGERSSGYWLVLNGGGFSKKVVQDIHNEISESNRRERIFGRLIFNEGPIFQRAVDDLVNKGKVA